METWLAPSRLAPDVAPYVARKQAEIALLSGCLEAPFDLPALRNAAEVIDLKFKLGAALRAERSLASWAITETARPERDTWQCGAFTLRYGYQRADLEVRGPPVYPDLAAAGFAEETLYTTSGMSALAALFTALAQEGPPTIRAARAGYGETRELVERFGARLRLAPWSRTRGRNDDTPCAVFVDSVSEAIPHRDDPLPRATRLVIFDTTCFAAGSGRIRRVVAWARRHDVPLALVRSHAKLDALGIEYGRLGSVVLSWRRAGPSAYVRALVREVRDCVRLLGSAAIPAHLPPFVGTPDYRRASAARTAAIMRNARLLARRWRETPLREAVKLYPHALYLTLAPRGELRVSDVKRAVDALSETLSAQGLAVRHAGSFGFDFTALEWFTDPVTRRNVMRVAPGDLPASEMEALAPAVVAWFAAQAPSTRRPPEPQTNLGT